MKFKLIEYVMVAIAITISMNAMTLTVYLPKSPVIATTTTATAPSASILAGIKTAKWGNNVKLSYAGENFTFVSNGIPNHARPTEYVFPQPGVMIPTPTTAYVGADPTRTQNYNFTLPLHPTKSAKPTSASLGAIGVMISGAVLFNPYDVSLIITNL